MAAKTNKKEKRISDRHDKASKVVDLIGKGKSLRFALLKVPMSSQTFYEWRKYLTDEEVESGVTEGENSKRYAHACDERERNLYEEIIDIADDCTGDKKEFVNNRGEVVEVEDREFTSRSKLKIEARQWVLSKMRPEKYGNNVQVKTEQDITISFKG